MHPLVTVAPLIRECMAGIADDAAHLMVISDADGTLLWLEGAPRVRLAAANSMNFAVGALWSEGGAGTNAIGTALAADHAVQVFAAEHFNEVVQAVDVRCRPGARPRDGPRARDHRPHEPDEHGAPALVRGRRRDRRARSRRTCACRCTSATRGCARATATWSRTAASPRALVMESGRVIACRPEGWTGPGRLTLPRWGGAFTLPSGAHAFAEPLDRDGAYLVRRLEPGRPGSSGGAAQLRLLGDDRRCVVVDGRTVAARAGARPRSSRCCACGPVA